MKIGKTILLILILFSCSRINEIQVRSSYVLILEVTYMERLGQEDRVVYHLKGGNGIRYWMETPLKDSAKYKVGTIYPFIVPR